MQKQKAQMKYIAAMALMLNLGVATVLRTTPNCKDGGFGKCRVQRGQSTAAQHGYQRRQLRRERYARLIHLS